MRKLLQGIGITLLIALPLLAATTKIRSVAISSSTIDSTTIGQTVPSLGTFTSLADQALSVGECVQATTGGALSTPLALPCLVPAVQSVATRTLSSPLTLTANTTQSLDSQAVTMPSVGCPCRVLIQYTYFNHAASGGATPGTVVIWVTDPGANKYAPSATSLSSVSDSQANSASGISVTFANSASTTFTVNARSDVTATLDTGDQISAGLQSQLKLSVLTSN